MDVSTSNQQAPRRYFYRCVYRAGRRIREYLGMGPVAEALAAIPGQRRALKEKQAAAMQEEQGRWETVQTPLLELVRLTDLVVNAALLAEGFHRHARGAWRRKNGRKKQSTT